MVRPWILTGYMRSTTFIILCNDFTYWFRCSLGAMPVFRTAAWLFLLFHFHGEIELLHAFAQGHPGIPRLQWPLPRG